MRSWQIVAVSAAGALIAGGMLCLPVALRTDDGVAAFAVEQWPAIAITFIGIYGIAALLLSTDVAFIDLNRPASHPGRCQWGHRYFIRLLSTQYFTAVVTLFALGSSAVSVDSAVFISLPPELAAFPAVAAGFGLAVLGLFCFLVLIATMRSRRAAELRAAVPDAQLQLLQEIAGLVRARSTPEFDAAKLPDLIERQHRTTVEAIKELTTAVNRLHRRLGDIRAAVQEREPALPAAVQQAVDELRIAVATLGDAMVKIDEMATQLSRFDITIIEPHSAVIPAGSASRLSTELRDLLKEMGGSAGHEDSPVR